jgi:zinc D-Ala-D-Ala carboxypeptidase
MLRPFGQIIWLAVLAIGVGCAPSNGVMTMPPATATTQATAVAITLPTATPIPPTLTPSATPTAVRPPNTPTPLPTATNTPTPTATPTATAVPSCIQRDVAPDDLLPLVNFQYGLGREYEPPDLISINDHFPPAVTKGYPNQVRAILLEPLKQLIADMQAAGLQPQIISGYRSYYSQNIAYQKWAEAEPERVGMLSARPGHSEHQLGTTVDFGSPVLYQYVEGADEDIEFHTYFFKTPEGVWLLENAHKYGFTLSYPREAQAATGFYYEPWHYRYVGVEMATFLKENGLFLTQFQLQTQPEPCIPD